MIKCVICEQRKGKRFCPLKDAMICSQCCGLIQTEGNCPEDCPFLKESYEFASEKQDERENQLGERYKRDFSEEKEEALQTFNAVSKPLNELFSERAEEDEHLEDKDLVEALDDVIKDLQMGIGKVVSAENVKLNRAGALAPLMKEILDDLEADPPVPEYLIVPSLEILRGLATLAMNDEDPKAYIALLLEQKEKSAAEKEEPIAATGEPVSIDIGGAQTQPPLEPSEAPEQPSASDLFEDAADEEGEEPAAKDER
ncbi:MAG: hypothetical protein JW759_01570 [Candidatus Coatesbacteria bacterium]|nr:hypothetical protein [Candidatus Coatesbacteria bacterium]